MSHGSEMLTIPKNTSRLVNKVANNKMKGKTGVPVRRIRITILRCNLAGDIIRKIRASKVKTT